MRDRAFYRSAAFARRPPPWRLGATLLAGLLAVLGALPSSPAPADPLTPLASHSAMPSGCARGCTEELSAPAGWKMQVFDNMPMSGSAAVTEAVIVVHGTGRNAQGYFASMMAAASQAGATRNTLVVAPWFKTGQDRPKPGEATWTSDAWKIGNGAESPEGLSSFLVMDQIIATLAARQRFPNLRHITLTGHSAGGQFTQRYAALGLAPNALSGVTVSYVPANPSSYVYFTASRPTGSGFGTPSSSSCSAYNEYKYGLQGRSGYPARLTPAQALANYSSRQVTIVNGGADTVQNGDMDTDCGAMLEGPNRASRGANFVRYMRAVAPDSSARQSRIVVPGVDHDGDAIFTDPSVRGRLFPLSGGSGAGSGYGSAEGYGSGSGPGSGDDRAGE
jgi:pimeloyl-ACP methyl ester carboxylesterase